MKCLSRDTGGAHCRGNGWHLVILPGGCKGTWQRYSSHLHTMCTRLQAVLALQAQIGLMLVTWLNEVRPAAQQYVQISVSTHINWANSPSINSSLALWSTKRCLQKANLVISDQFQSFFQSLSAFGLWAFLASPLTAKCVVVSPPFLPVVNPHSPVKNN